MKSAGWCLLILGLGCAVFSLLFDPSVASGHSNPSAMGAEGLSGRIANLSLLNFKTLLMVAGAGLFVSGAILIGMSSLRNSIVDAISNLQAYRTEASPLTLDREALLDHAEETWQEGKSSRRMPRL
jgi:hypothetical protein